MLHHRGITGRQSAVTPNPLVLQFIGHMGHAAFHIALDGLDLTGLCFRSGGNLSHDAHEIGFLPLFPGKEHQVTGLGLIAHGVAEIAIQPQLVHPADGVLPIRLSLQHGIVENIRILQTESDKEGIPILVALAIAIAIAGIAHQGFLHQNAVIAAFPVAQLGICNGQQILGPVAGQFHIPEHFRPKLCILHILGQVQIFLGTFGGMGMLRNGTDHLPCLIQAGFPVLMLTHAAGKELGFLLLFLDEAAVLMDMLLLQADEITQLLAVFQKAALVMDMLHNLLQLADHSTFPVQTGLVMLVKPQFFQIADGQPFPVAFRLMGMVFRLLHLAEQLRFPIASILMDMKYLLLQGAAKRAAFPIAQIPMDMDHLLIILRHKGTAQIIIGQQLIAFFQMHMGLQPAGSCFFQGDGRHDQDVGGQKYHHSRHAPDHFAPGTLPLSCFIPFYRLIGNKTFHSNSSFLLGCLMQSDLPFPRAKPGR